LESSIPDLHRPECRRRGVSSLRCQFRGAPQKVAAIIPLKQQVPERYRPLFRKGCGNSSAKRYRLALAAPSFGGKSGAVVAIMDGLPQFSAESSSVMMVKSAQQVPKGRIAQRAHRPGVAICHKLHQTKVFFFEPYS
jgi:hypothetical protein